MNAIPELPYGGEADPNSGWSGSDTSHKRAERQDADGTTARRQRDLLAYLLRMREVGTTWKEYSEATGLHHGATSSVLSVMHKAGRIERLTNHKRDRCKVYVLPEFVNERDTDTPGQTTSTELLDEFARVVQAIIPYGCSQHFSDNPGAGCQWCAAERALARWEARREQ